MPLLTLDVQDDCWRLAHPGRLFDIFRVVHDCPVKPKRSAALPMSAILYPRAVAAPEAAVGTTAGMLTVPLGTVFRLTTNGVLMTLVSFNGTSAARSGMHGAW